MKHFSYKLPLLLSALVCLNACQDDWLEVKRDTALIVPTSLRDMKMLLTDEENLAKDNINFIELSADDYYIPSSLYPQRTSIERNAYVWADDIYEGQQNLPDWDIAYAQIEVANVVLDGLPNIQKNSANEQEWNNVRGAALYLRAKATYFLAQTFSPPYTASSAGTDEGIPVRTSSDINIPTTRATVLDTYSRILADFQEAATLLPETAEFIMDPSQSSAYAFLARCYLGTRDFEKAFEFADKFLSVHSTLLDYNTLNPSLNFPIPRFNVEVIQHSEMSRLYGAYLTSSSRVPDAIRDLYDDNDLRKAIFFRNMGSGESGTYAFKGSYSGQLRLFSGISTNEVYLIRAECHARLGHVQESMNDLNALLIKRWRQGTFVNFTAVDKNEALNLVLRERRKELLRRGMRWSDLRRLNQEAEYAQTVTRTVDGTVYSLAPNDPRYVLPIPDYVINLSGISQNPR